MSLLNSLASSGHAYIHAVHVIHLLPSVDFGFSISIAFVGHRVAHVPHSVQFLLDVGLRGTP